MSDPHTVYIVDDDAPSREAVEMLLTEMKVCFKSFVSAEEFLEQYDGARPGCLVTDVRMLEMSGLELQEELRRRGITLPVVVVTAYADAPVVVRRYEERGHHLAGKPCRNHELWDAVREGLGQDTENLERERHLCALRQRLEKLTPSEKEVLDLIVAGVPNKAIASRLDISVRTVEVRRQSIFTKLQADSVAALVRLVVEAQALRDCCSFTQSGCG